MFFLACLSAGERKDQADYLSPIIHRKARSNQNKRLNRPDAKDLPERRFPALETGTDLLMCNLLPFMDLNRIFFHPI
jgi:hypothetical protein